MNATELRARWLASAVPPLRGSVLDVGAGAGILADVLIPSAHWIALEPTPGRRLAERVAGRPDSELLSSRAEAVPLPDASVDAVVCSTVLCSVADPARVLAEARRVLRGGGRLIFFEHVAADAGSSARRVQALLRPWTRRFGGGCDPTRDTERTIREAGFADVRVDRSAAEGWLGRLAPVVSGWASVS